MKKILGLCFAILVLTLQSCLPAPEPAPAVAPATNTGAQNSNGSTGLIDIKSSSLMVTQETSTVSLAEIAKKSTADVVVFEVYGVTCESCKVDGPYVSEALKKFGSKVQTIVIFPNKIGEYKRQDYEGFTNSYAARSAYVVDDTLKVRASIAADTTNFLGIYAVVAKGGQGIFLNGNDAYRSVESVVAKALGK